MMTTSLTKTPNDLFSNVLPYCMSLHGYYLLTKKLNLIIRSKVEIFLADPSYFQLFSMCDPLMLTAIFLFV